MNPVIDFHTHIFPDPLRPIEPYVGRWVDADTLKRVRSGIRGWLRPVREGFHHLQPSLRLLSDGARRGVDPLAMLATMPSLLVECTIDDLEDVIAQAGVSRAVVIAHHPWSSNDFVLDSCASRDNLIVAAQIPHGTAEAGAVLRDAHSRGARVLKIHAASDGGTIDSTTYQECLAVAGELKMPVILHTGCIHAKTLFKNPDMGHARAFEPWFSQYPSIDFVLAHMNLHEPDVAIEFAENFDNVYVDTSWQPAEAISEAVRRAGAPKVLFGSDWPLIGNNVAIGIARIRDCVDAHMISEADASLVLGLNAERLLSKGAALSASKGTDATLS